MNTIKLTLAICGVLVAVNGLAAEPHKDARPTPSDFKAAAANVTRNATPRRIPRPAVPAIPAAEPNPSQSSVTTMGSSLDVVQGPSITPNSTTLSPPVTLTYSGSSTAFTINDSGTGRGISTTLSNATNINSALFGETFGQGAGLTGFNAGTTGPGGKFQVVNAASAQAGAFASTNGTGSAVLGTVTHTNSNAPAILGINTVSGNTSGVGVGVQGQGDYDGVYGIGYGTDGYGVEGYSAEADGVSGQSGSGIGTAGYSTSNYGLYGFSSTSYGLYAKSTSSDGVVGVTSGTGYPIAGVLGQSTNAFAVFGQDSAGGGGVLGQSASGRGVEGDSTNDVGVVGYDEGNGDGVQGRALGSGNGVYGISNGGYAGYFEGPVAATAYDTVSDKNAKTHFKPVDGRDLLERVNQLPITSWDFKTDSTRRHVGPMAQDFKASFGLNGADDKHINLSDMAGVSLAAIQQLSRQLHEKDEEIAALEAKLSAQSSTMDAQSRRLDAQSNAVAELKAKTDLFAARMTALEQQRDIKPQTVALNR